MRSYRNSLGSMMVVLVATLFSALSITHGAGGLPALQAQLDAEEITRAAADVGLQQQIDTIELTPGQKGDTGDKGDKGDTGADGVDCATLYDHPWEQYGTDVYYNGGKVGIGTTAPGWKLHVVGTGPLLLDNTGAPNNDSILFKRFGVNQYTLGVTNEPSFFLYDQVAKNFRFTISSNGNFGIGTTNPQAKIHIGGNSGVDGLMFPDGTLQTTAANSSGSSLWATNSSDIYNTNSGNVGIGTPAPSYPLHVVGAQPLLLDNVDTANNGAILFRRFGVNQFSLGITNEPSLHIYDHVVKNFRFTINSNGNVGISDQTPTERLSVGGNIKATGTITQGSSRDLKEGITMISTKEAIETLQGLNPIKFKYKAEDSGEVHLGFIAEDVPDLVAFKDRKRLSSMDMTAVLVRVVQEQQKIIKEQQKNMDTMTQEIQKMKLTMNTL